MKTKERLMNNVQTAIQAIHSVTTNDELNQIIEAIKLKRQYLSKQAVRSFRVGDKIQFTSRGGVPVGGTVKKVNIKYVVCDTPLGQYRVPATMLEKV